jgi:hypothetical protein
MEIIHRLGAGLAIVACIPSIAAAQGFDERKIRPGQTVLVRDLAGGETKGIVERVDASRLIVKYGVGLVQDPANPTKTLNDTRVFAPAEVDRVRRPDPIWDGAVKGAAVALVPVFVHAECEGCERTGVNAVLLGHRRRYRHGHRRGLRTQDRLPEPRSVAQSGPRTGHR